MPAEFVMRPLGELVENLDGKRVPVKKADRRRGPYPYYGASGIVDHVDGYIFDGEHLLIAEDGENLRSRNTPIAFLARGKYWVNNHAHVVRGNAEADTRYLMYALQAVDVGGYLTGSAMPKLTQGNMNRILVPAPDVGEQRAIAHILGTLDDKIELNRRMNETLEAMGRAIFKSWFIDADVEESNSTWMKGHVEDIAQLDRDALDPRTSPEDQFEHYSIPAFDEQRLPAAELGSSIKSNKCLVPPQCILLSKLNPRIPRVWLPFVSANHRSICSTEFLVVLPRKGVPREWLYGLLSSSDVLGKFVTLVTGTSGSHQRVRPESLLAMPVHIPPNPLMERFATATRHLYSNIGRNSLESQTLASARDALLPQLISGQLSVATV